MQDFPGVEKAVGIGIEDDLGVGVGAERVQ
jgi:hypothetical protein